MPPTTSASPSPDETNTTPATGSKKPSVAAIVPVGPGHEEAAYECLASIRQAWEHSPGPFGSLTVHLINDHHGELGRSAARNKGLDQAESDWVLLIDADDLLLPTAFILPNLDYTAYWGSVCIERGIYMQNVYPCEWEQLVYLGARFTLSMGCFIRTAAARETRFLEPLDAGEDFEFFFAICAAHPFLKLPYPLVQIRRNRPSATGPRGYTSLDWNEACKPAVLFWRHRGRIPATHEQRLEAFTTKIQ